MNKSYLVERALAIHHNSVSRRQTGLQSVFFVNPDNHCDITFRPLSPAQTGNPSDKERPLADEMSACEVVLADLIAKKRGSHSGDPDYYHRLRYRTTSLEQWFLGGCDLEYVGDASQIRASRETAAAAQRDAFRERPSTARAFSILRLLCLFHAARNEGCIVTRDGASMLTTVYAWDGGFRWSKLFIHISGEIGGQRHAL